MYIQHDFNTVLKNFGREDFPDQLMLALHQFPNSDGLPWSGTEQAQLYFCVHVCCTHTTTVAAEWRMLSIHTQWII